MIGKGLKEIIKQLLLISSLYHIKKKQKRERQNRKGENQVVLLMITNGKKWHYTPLKSERTDDGFNRPIKCLSRLFRGITSKHCGIFIV